MKIWIARHGQTDLNHAKRMQGRTDAPLNKKGIEQAKQSRQNIGDVHFDAVYASPLQRAQLTGSIIGNVDIKDIIVDERLIETNFGKYEKCKYYLMGPAMTGYWMFPKLFPVPALSGSGHRGVYRFHEKASGLVPERTGNKGL